MTKYQTLRARAAEVEDAMANLFNDAEKFRHDLPTPSDRAYQRRQLPLSARRYGDAIRALARVRL